jgi:hypothetical protein
MTRRRPKRQVRMIPTCFHVEKCSMNPSSRSAY